VNPVREARVNLLVEYEAALARTVAEMSTRLVEVRRHLHRCPEPSCHERATSQYLFDQLRSAGIEGRLCRDGLGVVADLDVGAPAPSTPRIALRADIDALRIQDAKTTPYASQSAGLCHACGHDAHSTIVLGAALATARLREEGGPLYPPQAGLRLRFIFQPAEETAQGGHWMVEQGAVDGVAAILALHVDPERSVGAAGIRYGALTANCDELEVVIEGTGGHAARPHQTVDPIAAGVQLASALYQLLPRSVDARNASVFSLGRFSGGTLPNVIPGRVELLGTLRTLDQHVRQTLHDRIAAVIRGIEISSGATIRARWYESIDGVMNDDRATAALESAARAVLGEAAVQRIPLASMGAEDFSAYLSRTRGAMFRLGVAPPGEAAPLLHHPNFDIDERALEIGPRILLGAAWRLTAELSLGPDAG
jgi:amidohydrolase